MIQQIQLALMIYDLGLASDAALAAPADEATAATAKLHTQIEAWGTDPAKAVGLPEAAFTMPLALMNYDLGLSMTALRAAGGAYERAALMTEIHGKVRAWREDPLETASAVLIACLKKNGNRRQVTAKELGMPSRTFYLFIETHQLHARIDEVMSAAKHPAPHGPPRTFEYEKGAVHE